MRPRRLPQSKPVTKPLMRVFAIQPYVPEKAPIGAVRHVIFDSKKGIKSPRGFVRPHVSPPLTVRERFGGPRFYLPVTPIALAIPNAVTFEPHNLVGFLFHQGSSQNEECHDGAPYWKPSKSKKPLVIGSLDNFPRHFSDRGLVAKSASLEHKESQAIQFVQVVRSSSRIALEGREHGNRHVAAAVSCRE